MPCYAHLILGLLLGTAVKLHTKGKTRPDECSIKTGISFKKLKILSF